MSKNQTWYSMDAKDKNASIYIYEEIGFWGVTAKSFIQDLKALGDIDNITLHLHTPGGSVGDGTAIYNSIKNHKATVTVEIEGYALSMGSIIALAGDTVKMADNALLMIHNPMGFVFGDAHEMHKQADTTEKHKEIMLNTYQAKTGLNRDILSKMMDDETWFTADEALENGFIDEVIDAVKLVASANTQKFINDLNLKNQPINFLGTVKANDINPTDGLITAFKKFVSHFPKQKKETNPMTIQDLKALFNAKKDTNTAYQAAAAAHPDLANQISVGEDETPKANNPKIEPEPDVDVVALGDKIDILAKQLATTNQNHQDLVLKLSATIENFKRDESTGIGISTDTADTDDIY